MLGAVKIKTTEIDNLLSQMRVSLKNGNFSILTNRPENSAFMTTYNMNTSKMFALLNTLSYRDFSEKRNSIRKSGHFVYLFRKMQSLTDFSGNAAQVEI